MNMKTTVLMDKEVYKKLVNEAIQKHGSAKNISLTLNEMLKARFAPVNSMFGQLKRFPLKGLRDESDRSS